MFIIKNSSRAEKVPREVEFIQGDGAADEGPSHLEEQILWTERHISLATKVTLFPAYSKWNSFY